MKASKIILIPLLAFGYSQLFGALPEGPLKELMSGKIKKTITHVAGMPPPLQRALAKTFHQECLELADPGHMIGGSVTYTNDPARLAPHRRLIFAFETEKHAFIYYESGDPENSPACVVFDIEDPQSPRFVWGGADMKRPFAKNPRQLRAKILGAKLADNYSFIW
jgi:hypothetical protein